MPSIVYFLSNWGSTNYEMVIENRFFCQLQFGQVCSQTLKSIIVNEWRREVNSSCGTSGKARWRIQSELHIICCGFWPWTLDLMFQIESQVLSSDFFSGHAESLPWMLLQWGQFSWFSWKCSTGFFFCSCSECRSFLTKPYLPVSVPVGGRKENTKQLESFLFRWTSGLRGFITNLQGPSRFILPLSLLLSPLCLCLHSPVFFSLPASYIRATASIVPPSTVTNWHAEFSTGTLNHRDQGCRESSFISSPFGNCLCSS